MILKRSGAAKSRSPPRRKPIGAKQDRGGISCGAGGLPSSDAQVQATNPQRMEELKEFDPAKRHHQLPHPPQNIQRELADHHRPQPAAGSDAAGYRTVPCIIKGELDDAEAIPIMIADNLNNRTVLPSERGWAYRQLLELYNRQGARSDLTCAQNEHKLEGRTQEIF